MSGKARCIMTLQRHPNQTTKAKTTAMNHRNVNAFECTLTLQDKASVGKGSAMHAKFSLLFWWGSKTHDKGCPILVSCRLKKDWQQDLKGMKTINNS